MNKCDVSAVETLAAACQVTAGRAIGWCMPPPSDELAEPFRRLSPPETRAGAVLTASILTAFVDSLGIRLHANFHGTCRRSVDCRFQVPRLEPCELSEKSAAELLTVWLHQYEREFDRTHCTMVRKAKQYVVRQFATPVRVAALAIVLGTHERTLQRTFAYETGITVREYQARVRLANALPQLYAGDKVEAVAMTVGWKSKKDLYRAMHRVIGMHPSTVRTLSIDAVNGIVHQLLNLDHRVKAAA
jgi:AraC-like DNA-binding protein